MTPPPPYHRPPPCWLQGLHRKRAARAVYRAKLHRVWEKVFDEASNEYYYEHRGAHGRARTAWDKPTPYLYGETPRKERDVCLWPVDHGGIARWAEEGSVAAFLESIRVPNRTVDLFRHFAIDGT